MLTRNHKISSPNKVQVEADFAGMFIFQFLSVQQF